MVVVCFGAPTPGARSFFVRPWSISQRKLAFLNKQQETLTIILDEINFNQDDIKLIDNKAKKIISNFKHKLENIDKLNKETLESIINQLIKSNDTNFKGVGQPLRIALTGSKFGPGIYDIIISLGKDEVIKRLTSKKLI